MSLNPASPSLGLPFARLVAIVLFAAIAPSVLLTAPAIAGQLVKQWSLSPSQVGNLFSAELAAMSLATLPAYFWQSRFDWRKVATAAGVLFIAANLASAWAEGYSWLLALRALSALGGGTLMVLCMASAASSLQRDRVYGLWVAGQLAVGALGLWVLPGMFARFGLQALYFGLALLMLLCLPLARAFPPRLEAAKTAGTTAAATSPRWAAVYGIAAVLIFYVGLSGVWTFIGSVADAAGIAAASYAPVLALASLLGIVGSVTATLIGSRWPRRALLVLGYVAMTLSVLLLIGKPDATRFAVAALLFKFTWTFVLPFILAAVAEHDQDGRLMSTVNLVIGGGLAVGPAIAGPLVESAHGLSAMLLASAGALAVSLALVLGTASQRRLAPRASRPLSGQAG